MTADGPVSIDSDMGDIFEREAEFGWGWTVTVDCHDCGLERLALPFRFAEPTRRPVAPRG